MLSKIRDTATGWIAGIIVGALIISFAFWGVSFYFDQGGDVNVARVNGTEIKLQTYQRTFYNLRQQMQSLFGDNLSAEEDETIRDQTIEKLINAELVNQIVDDTGLRVTNKKVVEKIKNLEFFKNEKGFDRSKYDSSIDNLGMEPAFFERQLRMELLSEQLQAGLSESLFVLEPELDDILRLKLQTRDISYSILEFDSFIDDSEIDDEQIESYYQSNLSSYAEPEKVRIAYIELDVKELAASIETDEESLKEYYQNNKDEYDVVEQRSVTKLFVKTDAETSEEDQKKAREVINSVMTLIDEGKSFDEVLEQFTEEGKGALEFSEHAFMAKGMMEQEIDEFLFSSAEGEISRPIETEKGINIVKVGEIRGGPKNTFENAAAAVERDFRQNQAELEFFALADQLTTLSYEHADTLEIAAEEIDRPVVETEFFSRENAAEKNILSNPLVISSSFDPELISTGQNSDAIELADNHIVVLKVIDHKAATTKKLDDVTDDVIVDIRTEQARQKIKETGADIVEQLKSGATPEQLDGDIEIEWSVAEKAKRDDTAVNRAVLRTAFQSGKPEDDTPVVTGHSLGSGDYAIVMVTAVYEGELVENEEDQENDKTREAAMMELLRVRGSGEWQEFLENAKSNADVEIYNDNI